MEGEKIDATDSESDCGLDWLPVPCGGLPVFGVICRRRQPVRQSSAEVVAKSLPDYNRWAGRCQFILQGGRHVADIAVLYPITGIYAVCSFGHERTLFSESLLSGCLRRSPQPPRPKAIRGVCLASAAPMLA